MIVWVVAQLSPDLAHWLKRTFGVEAYSVRDVGLRGAKDWEIYRSARKSGAVVMTKDADFTTLASLEGAPPQVLWITCGNTSNRQLKRVLKSALPTALGLLEQGEPLVEISGRM